MITIMGIRLSSHQNYTVYLPGLIFNNERKDG